MKKIYFFEVFFTVLMLLFTTISAKSQTKADSLIIELKSTTEDSSKVKILLQLSHLYILSDLKKSFTLANQALALAQKNKLENEFLKAQNTLGKICFDMGLMDNAAIYFNRNLELLNKSGNKLQRAKANQNVGAVWLYLGKFEKAESYHLTALQLLQEYAKENNNEPLHPSVINIYNNLGIIYRETNNPSKSKMYIEKGIYLAVGNPEFEQTLVFLLHNQGDLLLNQKKIQQADSVIEQSIELCKKIHYVAGLATSYKLKGRMNEINGNTIAALSNYQKGYYLLNGSENNVLVQELSNKLQLIYKKLGKIDSAFKYLNIDIATQKKIKEQEANEVLVTMENKQKFATWQKEVESKEKTTLVNYWIFIVVILVTAIVGLIFYVKKQKLHNQLRLEKIENELSIQRLELDGKLLRSNIEQKDKQLTNDILYQIKNTEMIDDVVKNLLTQTNRNTSISKEIIQESIRHLVHTKENNVWQEFEIRFKNVHKDFYNNLQQRFPNLTAHERRLCAFLRLNMTSKEIAAITAQHPKSIDVARARLRKKIGIANEDIGLVEFMNSI